MENDVTYLYERNSNLDKNDLLFKLKDYLKLFDDDQIKFIFDNFISYEETKSKLTVTLQDNLSLKIFYAYKDVRWYRKNKLHSVNKKPAIMNINYRAWYRNGHLINDYLSEILNI